MIVVPQGSAQTQVREAVHMDGARPTVLLVEDDPTVRTLVGRILRRIGCQVEEAESAEGAIACLEDPTMPAPALLFLDVRLPGMNGVELARHLRERFPAVPVLFISGDAQFSRLGHSEEPGVLFLAKPFRMSVLEGYVRGLLGVPKTPRIGIVTRERSALR